MNYAEASYFDGYHFRHIAAYYEYQRLLWLRRAAARVTMSRRGRRHQSLT
jgi:hypothetical protein